LQTILRLDNLEKIYKFILDVKNTTPVFVEHPEIVLHMNAYSKIYEEHLSASGDSFDYWMNNEGFDIDRLEQEEIEDSPELMKKAADEIQLKQKEEETAQKEKNALNVLHSEYERITGKKIVFEKDWEMSRFWHNQLFIYNIYLTVAPKLLPQHAGETAVEPLNMYR
jgi:hypothetical protein